MKVLTRKGIAYDGSGYEVKRCVTIVRHDDDTVSVDDSLHKAEDIDITENEDGGVLESKLCVHPWRVIW